MRAWLAQMYFALGSTDPALRRPGEAATPAPPMSPDKLSKQSKDYLTKSRDAYLQLLDEAAKNPKAAPSETAVLAAKMQLGQSYDALGQFDKALDTYFEILQVKEQTLAVQRAAALAYQDRGQNEDFKFFDSAILGGYKTKETGENRVWGWLKISQVTDRAAATNPKFKDAFYEARLHLSKCRYLAALQQKGDQRKQSLTKAKQSAQSFAQLYPELGGDRWKAEFEQLMKDIDQAEKTLPEDSKS
jgi:tetratricopeptide (TPR) repeat protein